MASAEPGVFLFLYLCLLLLNSCHSIQNVCNETSKNSSCMLSNNIISDSCVNYQQNLLSPFEKNLIISIHSSLRKNLTKSIHGKLPKALNLKNMSWNDSLAEMAQKWAAQCKPSKDPLIRYGNEMVGQNLATAEVDNPFKVTLNDLMSKWVEGLTSLAPEIVSKYEKPKPGEVDYEPAAQMIWGNTSQLGCGRSVYKSPRCIDMKMNCSANHTVVQMVCNYFPAGNKEGEPIYIKARAENKKTKVNNTNYNRIKNRMLELWPAAVGKAFYPEMSHLKIVFVLLLENFLLISLYLLIY